MGSCAVQDADDRESSSNGLFPNTPQEDSVQTHQFGAVRFDDFGFQHCGAFVQRERADVQTLEDIPRRRGGRAAFEGRLACTEF